MERYLLISPLKNTLSEKLLYFSLKYTYLIYQKEISYYVNLFQYPISMINGQCKILLHPMYFN